MVGVEVYPVERALVHKPFVCAHLIFEAALRSLSTREEQKRSLAKSFKGG